MKTKLLFTLLLALFPGRFSLAQESVPRLNLTDLDQLAEVEERYQSFNVEMCEVVGGDFWIPYDLLDPEKVRNGGLAALKRTIPPIDLSERKLKILASALGPTYIRVSGTWANTTYFQDNDQPKLDRAPDGYENVLTRKEWKGVLDFCRAVDGKLVTSFAISEGMRDPEGNWTPAQMEPLINYTRSIEGEIYAAEMFNEPSHASHGGAPDGYDASSYSRDFSAFKSFVKAKIPEMKIMGPGSTGEGGIIPVGETMSTDKLLSVVPKPEFEIFSYHFYGGLSKRCMGGLTPEDALSEDWLSKTELGLKFYEDARDRYQPRTPIWLTETAEAGCGGDPWAATYVDCFRYLEQLGRLAKKGVKVVMHNTLAAGEYALLEQDTHEPRPNYWAALLWNRLMGTRVFDAGLSVEGMDIFVHNLKNSPDGLAVLMVNPEEVWHSVGIPGEAEQYMLTADSLLTKTVKLNGKVLELGPEDMLPAIHGEKIPAGEVRLPPHSILFLAIPDVSGQRELTRQALSYETTDTLFSDPFIDVDEWRDVPVRHRYVHGGFKGTDTRFSYYFPEQEDFEGHFFQYVTPVPDSETLSQGAEGEADKIGFSITHGAYFIETNGGGATYTYGSRVDPLIGAYRANVACAQFSKRVATELYGAHRTYGYIFGGSGGAYRTIGAIENNEEKAALEEATRMGFNPESWYAHETMGIHAFGVLYPGMVMADPGYFEEFWTVPGYLGYDDPGSFKDDRIQHKATIVRIVTLGEGQELGLPVYAMPGQARGTADAAWQNLDEKIKEVPVAIQLDSPMPRVQFL